MQVAIPATMMRGGTSKGLYFLKEHLPEDREAMKPILLAAMGSPDERQIDGVGGAVSLTSKVAIVSKSERDDADIDYLFAQVVVDKAHVDFNQNCGNILCGVGPFAIEQGLIEATHPVTDVRINMVNSDSAVVVQVQTPNGQVEYQGDHAIAGVPGTAAPLRVDFLDTEGSACGSLLPTGNAIDEVNGVRLTCIDNGMPNVIMRAEDFGLTGKEDPAELEANIELKEKVEAIRLAIGEKMNLGDVGPKTTPKMVLASAPDNGGVIHTRSFIPHKCHTSIGVLAAVTVATACLVPGSILDGLAVVEGDGPVFKMPIEHPTGVADVEIELAQGGTFKVARSSQIRTARKLFSGEVFVPESATK